MPIAEIKTYAEVAEIIVTIVAIIIAGVWALYGLVVFRRRQAAVTELRKVESEAARLELEARRRAVLDITVSHQAHPDIAAGGYMVTIQVCIKNTGVAAAHLQFEGEGPPITIRQITFTEDGEISFLHPATVLRVPNASDPSKDARGRVIRAGGISRLSTAVRLRTGGVYSVTFRVPMDESNRKAMIEAGAPDRRHYWSASSIVWVGTSPAATAHGV